MIAVIFELIPRPGRREDYFGLAKALAESLETVEGFISVERFQSLAQPAKLLSLSFWRDEAAVARWRNLPEHREAQKLGRAGIFESYRLRVAGIVRDYGLNDRDQAPPDSLAAHLPS